MSEAANSVEAISQAIDLQPDVIVMDVSMPQMNGLEATRQIHGVLARIRISARFLLGVLGNVSDRSLLL